MNENDFRALSAASALRALDAADQGEFQRALEAHPEWQTIVDEDRAAVAILAETVAPETPRAEVKRALFEQLDALIDSGMVPSAMREHPTDAAQLGHRDPLGIDVAQVVTPAPSIADPPAFRVIDAPTNEPLELFSSDDTELAVPRRRRLGTRVVAALAITALIAGVGAGLFGVIQPPQPESVVAIEQIAQAPDAQFASTAVATGGQAGLTWSLAEGRAVLVTKGLDRAPSGHTYELWYVRGEEKIPAGTFDPDETGDAAVLVSGEMHEGDTIAVTVEVTGGSVDGTPSEVLVLAIPTGPAGESA